MPKRILEGLERLAGRWTSHPPPDPGDPSQTARIRNGLAWFHAAAPERFSRLFLRGRPLRASRRESALFRLLEPRGLVTHLASSFWSPLVRIVPFGGRFLAADRLTYGDPDQVFTPMFEQVYFVRNMGVAPGDDVLEIGVGSGVISLCAAAIARRVIGVDLGERALAFARFNRDLNGGAGSLELRRGSLYDPVEPGRRFDLVLVNPPFEPVPPGESRFRHSDGGADGLDVVRSILVDLPRHLTPDGRLEIVSWSPGSARHAVLVDLIREALPDHRLRVDVLDVWPIRDHLDRFRSCPTHADWCADLAARGLALHFLFVRAARSSAPTVELRHPREEVEACHAVADLWVG